MKLAIVTETFPPVICGIVPRDACRRARLRAAAAASLTGQTWGVIIRRFAADLLAAAARASP